MTKFEELYKLLNKEQKTAVDAIEGPVMVVAGPGTGKTRILTLRIANILKKTDTDPENILALTFTDAAAATMRRRLSEIIGPAAYRVNIFTFHGFCNGVIKNYPEEFPRIIGARPINDIGRVARIEKLIDRHRGLLRPFGAPYLYVKPILKAITELKREAFAPAEFKKIITRARIPKNSSIVLRSAREKQIAKNRELASLYSAYENSLAVGGFYDWDDMIMEVLRAFRRNRRLLLEMQEQYQYVLVDEHQDTNRAQNKILELLMSYHKHPDIFTVGDVKQAIFRFQGASLENFNYFRRTYPGAKLIILARNYRSGQGILDSAHSLLAGDIPLKAQIRREARVHFAPFSGPEAEQFFVAEDIRQKISSGVPAEEIAVLYRDNADAAPLARALEKLGAPFAVESDRDLLADPDVRKLLVLLRAVNFYGEDEYLAEALHLDFLGAEPLEVYKLIRRAHAEKKNLYDLLKSGGDFNFSELFRKLSLWARLAKNENLLLVFEKILEESGFLRVLLRRGRVEERLGALEAFFEELKNIVETHPSARLANLFEYLDTVEKHNLFARKSAREPRPGRVRLMTVHRAKGLEFDYVYIIGATDGHFGGRRASDRLSLLPEVYLCQTKLAQPDTRKSSGGFANDDDDERRLFYVALTRARKGAMITHARLSADGRERLPSRFVSEIKPEFLERLDTGKFERSFEKKKIFLTRPARPASSGAGRAGKFDKRFVWELFEEHGLSITALNNYLECPWNYFYSNLLRLPKARNKHALYGTAVHFALRDFFKNLKARPTGKKSLLESFKYHLRRQPLSERDFTEVLTKGRKALAGWYDKHHKNWLPAMAAEFEIKGVKLPGLPVRLTGKLDKLESLGGKKINVVDYKTRQPPTRNQIEGKTREQKFVNYKRQLVFYKILLDNFGGKSSLAGKGLALKIQKGQILRSQEEPKFKMISGELDFIEPDSRGKYRKEKFEITEAETVELKKTLARAAREISNLSFWNKRCERKKCQYCALRELIG